MLITLNYTISDFINNAKVLSMYRASTANNEGKSPDDTNLTNNDESFLDKFLRIAAAKLADVFSGYTVDLYDTDGETLLEPFEYDVTLGTGETAQEHQIVYRINMPDTFRTATLHMLDASVKDAFDSYILYRTAKHRAIEFESYKMDWENSLGEVRTSINRRTTSTRRNYNMW